MSLSNRQYLDFQPSGLRRNDDARSNGIGVTKFDELVRRGLLPEPLRIDGCVIWDVKVRDIAFVELSEPSNDWDE